jgi:hypothetical protein
MGLQLLIIFGFIPNCAIEISGKNKKNNSCSLRMLFKRELDENITI